MILELGGLVAIVHVRGGGERGFRWQSEVKLDRTKTLEDMAAASRWLKARHPGMRVAVSGDSYGGLHALASLVRTQPDYDLVVASLPVTDIIHFLENGVFGKSAWDDFGLAHNEAGDLVKASEEIAVLKSWSPIEPDNLARLQEPIQPILMLTSDTDDRVEPEHAYVMTRALRERFMNAPVYLWAEQGIGHRVVGMEDKEITFIAAHFDIETRNDLF